MHHNKNDYTLTLSTIMNLLPLEISKIVHRYIYDCVVTELKTTYYTSLKLKTIVGKDCTRIRADTYFNEIDQQRVWIFRSVSLIGQYISTNMWISDLDDKEPDTSICDAS